MIKALEQISLDMEQDATTLDGQPFTGRVVATQFGNQCAAIKALALILKEHISRG